MPDMPMMDTKVRDIFAWNDTDEDETRPQASSEMVREIGERLRARFRGEAKSSVEAIAAVEQAARRTAAAR